MSHWECSVCGYVHKEAEPPESCPVCDAPKNMFNKIAAEQPSTKGSATENSTRRWRCNVCGYIHQGNEPPDQCPVCAAPKSQFVEIDGEGNKVGGQVEASPPATTVQEIVKPAVLEKTWLNRVSDLILKLHLHPITVHFPNGILPAATVFLALAVFLHLTALELAAFYNFIFVLLMLPFVLITGFVEWQKRYKGIKSMVFITKIFCSLVVLAGTNILVFWRLIDPAVASQGSIYRLLYLGIAAGVVGAAGIAGHLGGKLVFAARG